jgi:UDPglucose 6-dehydrogenase
MDVNRLQKQFFIGKIDRYYKSDLKGLRFAVWGLAFKPNTDDIREAPALEVIDFLLAQGAEIVAYDPEAVGHVRNIYGNRVAFSENQYQALDGADALIICTEWNEFRAPDFAMIEELLNDKVIFDGRNLYDVSLLDKLGFVYESMGRPYQKIHSI